MTNYSLYCSLVTLMYNVEDSALTASSSAPDSFPHHAKLVDLSSFARKGIKTVKMERVEQSQRGTDHIGESCCNLEYVICIHSCVSDAWVSKRMDNKQWVQVDLGSETPVYGIELSGSSEAKAYVTSFNILYSDDGNIFSYVEDDVGPKLFRGPYDPSTPIEIMLAQPIETRYIRISPRLKLISVKLPVVSFT